MIFADLTMSLDGFVAGPNQTLQEPLGAGGEQLHQWALAASAWRQAHGHEGGEAGVDSDVITETTSRTGAGIMGRKMFSGGSGGWADDPNPTGWWGEEPPFHHPVYVVTHHEREPLELTGTTFTFVQSFEEALRHAQGAAGEQDVQIHGGGTMVQQALAAGALDELNVHIAPHLLGSGSPLLGGSAGRLERARVIESPSGVTHIRYRVVRIK